MKHSLYEYLLQTEHGERKAYYTDLNNAYEPNKYWYIIKLWDEYERTITWLDSDEWYDTEEQANQAAIDHIDRLENGETL
jgi:hypothetical protein